jgi:hypothetical protein
MIFPQIAHSKFLICCKKIGIRIELASGVLDDDVLSCPPTQTSNQRKETDNSR